MPRSRAGIPRIVARLDRQRLRQHARPDRRRDVPTRPRRRLRELLRRDEVPGPPGGRGRGSPPVPRSSSPCPARPTGRGDHSAIGAQLKAAYDGTARFIGLRRSRASRRPTSTTWPPGSSPRSTAGGSARPTCSAGENMRLREAHGDRGAGRRAPPAAARRSRPAPSALAARLAPDRRAPARALAEPARRSSARQTA